MTFLNHYVQARIILVLGKALLHTIVCFLSCSWRLCNRLIFLLNMLLNQQMSALTQRNISLPNSIVDYSHLLFLSFIYR